MSDFSPPMPQGPPPRDASLATARPDQTAPALGRRRLAVVMFADVVEFSKKMHENEAAALSIFKEAEQTMRRQVAAHSGRIIKTIGDAVMAEFESTLQAVSCAISIQEAMAAANVHRSPDHKMKLRIGVHLGDVLEQPDGDLLGDAVNIAARLQPLASPGGIIFSEEVYVQVRNKLRGIARALGAKELKNISRPVRTYAVDEPAVHSRLALPLAGIAAILVGAGAGIALRLYAQSSLEPPPAAAICRITPDAPGDADLARRLEEALTDALPAVPGLRALPVSEGRQIAACAAVPSPLEFPLHAACVACPAGRAAYAIEGVLKREGDALVLTLTMVRTSDGQVATMFESRVSRAAPMLAVPAADQLAAWARTAGLQPTRLFERVAWRLAGRPA